MFGHPDTQSKGSSVLMLAVVQDDTPSTLALLKRGARDIDARAEAPDAYGFRDSRPLLLVASQHGNLEIVQALLDRGAKRDVRNAEGHTALMEVIISLAEIHGDTTQQKPAREAATRKYRATMRLLLDRGVPLEATDVQGFTALWLAALVDEPELVSDLLDRHADPNRADPAREWTPLNAAIHSNDVALVELMLAKGADINSHAADPPLLFALKRDKLFNVPNPNMLRLLLERGADIHARRRPDPNDEGSNVTAMLMATELTARAHVKETFQLLLSYGADIEERNKEGRTALMLVTEQGNVPTVRYLLDHGAHLNAHDLEDETPLHLAVDEDNQPVVTLLLKRGAKVNARNAAGETPLDRALARKDKALIALLKEYGATR